MYFNMKYYLNMTPINYVFLKVIPTTEIGKIMKSKKLTPQFISPY